MFNKIFGSGNNSKSIHCETTGKISSIDDTVVLTKIDSVILLNGFKNPKVNEAEKKIYSETKPPLKYYSEIDVPDELKSISGRVFSKINDEEDLERSTAVISPEGRRLYSGRQLLPFVEYFGKYEMVQIPNTMFVAVIDNVSNVKKLNCQQWNIGYNSIGSKYRYKKIIKEDRQPQTFGRPGILMPGFNVAVSDCSQKNPQGTGYLFKTDDNFQQANFSCNESAVEFCQKNNCLVYYLDFLNDGKLRILTAYTQDVNKKLQNPYLFRSSNI